MNESTAKEVKAKNVTKANGSENKQPDNGVCIITGNIDTALSFSKKSAENKRFLYEIYGNF